jgi:hypothetical protein
MATWRIITPEIAMQRIDQTDTTQNLPLGTIVQARDTSSGAYGTGEFMYAKGVASTVVGSWVLLNHDGTTTLVAAGGVGQIGVAMSANVANQYGWYQINGKADVKTVTASGTLATDLYIGSTAGEAKGTTQAGDRIWNVKLSSTATTTLGTAVAQIQRPFTNAGKNSSV